MKSAIEQIENIFSKMPSTMKGQKLTLRMDQTEYNLMQWEMARSIIKENELLRKKVASLQRRLKKNTTKK